MPISSRAYIVADGSSLRRVPQRVREGLIFEKDALPEYAGTRQKVADVVIENQDGKPVRILDVRGSYWEFDAEGKIDEGLRRSSGEWIDYAMSSHGRAKKQQGRVVDLVPELKRKELHDRHRWPVTQDLVDLIAADIWPGIHGPAPDVSVVKGKTPKKPPLTGEAKRALSKIEMQLEIIRSELSRLSEPALKGLEFEARRIATYEHAALWEGVAGAAALQREINAAYRTGNGEWVAIVEAFQRISPIEEDVVAREEVKCVQTEAFVIVGYQPGSGAVRVPIANLKVATFDGTVLRYAGAVGTGFSEKVGAALRDRLQRLQVPKCLVPGLKAKGAVWVAPDLKAEVAFRGRSANGELRAASFKGLVG